MFAKKNAPPEPNLPGLPPVLRIGEPSQLASIAEESPAARIAHAIIAQAFREGAMQITLTPEEKGLEVHYLISGEWRETMRMPHHIAPSLGTAFKTLSGLPLWEYRMALEGLIVVQHGEADYDVHLAITPTRRGEKIMLRMEAV